MHTRRMAPLTRTTTLHAAIDDWAKRGLLPKETADILRQDIGPVPQPRGFAGFVILAGVICLIFGAITFVSANWHGMTRLTRVALIFAALWASWGGVAYARLTGRTWLSGVLTLLACGLFGAGIMLISQMYHIQGDARDAVWLWMLGTLVAAALAASPMALALMFGLLVLWHFMLLVNQDLAFVNLGFLPFWAAGAALCLWMKSRVLAHLATIALAVWCLSEVIIEPLPIVLFMVTTALGFAVLALLLASHAGPRLLNGFEPEAIGYVLVVTGLALVPIYLVPGDTMVPTEADVWLGGCALGVSMALILTLAFLGRTNKWRTDYDLWVTAAALGLTTLAFFGLPVSPAMDVVLLGLSIWCVRIGHRLSSTLVRVFGGLWFAGMMLTIYAKTLGSLISTSLFYLGAGALLLFCAFIAARLARRNSTP